MTRQRNRPAKGRQAERSARSAGKTVVRIIGGRLRGRRLICGADPRTRPMKDRVREATFNLIGPAVQGMHAMDLFAGTGVLGLEAISRGAARATLIEHHFPTVRDIQQNVGALSLDPVVSIVAADTFVWARRLSDIEPGRWLVFCCPPYRFYRERIDDMLHLIGTVVSYASAGSIVVVESDQGLDVGRLPQREAWDVRYYPPASIALYRAAGA